MFTNYWAHFNSILFFFVFTEAQAQLAEQIERAIAALGALRDNLQPPRGTGAELDGAAPPHDVGDVAQPANVAAPQQNRGVQHPIAAPAAQQAYVAPRAITRTLCRNLCST